MEWLSTIGEIKSHILQQIRIIYDMSVFFFVFLLLSFQKPPSPFQRQFSVWPQNLKLYNVCNHYCDNAVTYNKTWLSFIYFL